MLPASQAGPVPLAARDPSETQAARENQVTRTLAHPVRTVARVTRDLMVLPAVPVSPETRARRAATASQVTMAATASRATTEPTVNLDPQDPREFLAQSEYPESMVPGAPKDLLESL